MRHTRVSEVFDSGGLTLLAVESLQLERERYDYGWLAYGSMRPIAIVVCEKQGAYAMDMDANTIELEQLLREVPDLESFIA